MKYIAIFLVLLCCFMGAASAAEDISTDLSDSLDSVDDSVAVDAVSEDASESVQTEHITDSSDDTTEEQIINDTKDVEQTVDSANVESQTRATSVDAYDWDDLKDYGTSTTNYNINLKSPITVDSTTLTFGNSVTIIGTPSNYITGGSSSKIPFQSTGSLNIKFVNVTFKNMAASVLIKLATTGTNQFINCNFDNIHTYAYKSSVIWNDKGYMNISGCNFTNCNNGFGVITNYATSGTVQMNVENCRFENNTGRLEPGAINNCGDLNVTNCTFIHNTAGWWAGAIHTHTNSYTRIIDSTFTDNVAGWNGGALFTYGKLEVINSNFTDNNCTTNTGGGAICGYSYQGSIYNITVDSCNFIHNINKNSNGRGGAIGVQNIGYLTVFNSIFMNNNNATNGTAISAICEDVTYCNNCTNCSCPNCPNCENCSHNVSTGDPDAIIYNNTFINHGGPGDTVVISGNDYIFYDNRFVNSVQTVHYNESGNQYGLTSSVLNSKQHNILSSQAGNNILSLAPSDVFYVNGSKAYNGGDDGQSWENALGGSRGISKAFSYINSNGIIYITDTFDEAMINDKLKENITIIGFNKETAIIATTAWRIGNHQDPNHYLTTFINITFIGNGAVYGNDLTFINCTFLNFKTNEPLNDAIDENAEYYEGNLAPEESFVTTFIDCEFINSTLSGENLIDIDKYTQINFNNCNFENITADSIVSSKNGRFHTQDGINFNDCKFTNVTTKGIVSIPTGNDITELVHIEGCTYDVPVTNDVLTDSGRDYINTTQSRADSKLTIGIDGDNLVITLTDSEGNPIADVDEIAVVVNGTDSIPIVMENGVAVLNISDYSGQVSFDTSFAGNSNYKESSASLSTYIIVKTVTIEVPIAIEPAATTIDANALTATAKVAKTLSVTLKDANGKAIANKTITYSINGVTKTATTDANGIVKIAVNPANAGTYYYSISFLGDNDYKASFKTVKVTVNKQATKAVFKGKTFKVKAAKKVSFTLKDASGKAIKGKKITFKVGKKTYTAKTNAKGVATAKVKLTKKGKTKVTAKFAGDSTYKAVTKKAKITVK
ncbi:Ig-like domain-containing protein [Methanobrevibacter sp.]|uniref:Ig-like domain-containing protein n=1 Tax=Methanobrevibacter sp. TaxID=66852 RepID=UPI002E796AAB|nr:Ig-like domain repeat protein [Methanobrevibacter sp.]MEE1335876.1 Ig-like domain-containing protein [Methanobrevibacter sp.]